MLAHQATTYAVLRSIPLSVHWPGYYLLSCLIAADNAFATCTRGSERALCSPLAVHCLAHTAGTIDYLHYYSDRKKAAWNRVGQMICADLAAAACKFVPPTGFMAAMQLISPAIAAPPQVLEGADSKAFQQRLEKIIEGRRSPAARRPQLPELDALTKV